jgi:prolipoprotein diacylglyceryltransferase
VGKEASWSLERGDRIPGVPDVSILDLFWLILKFLAALGMVCALFAGLYLICRLAWEMLRTLPRLGQASTGIIVAWVLVLVAIVTLVMNFWSKGFGAR